MGKKYIIELEGNESVYKTVYNTIIADEHPILQVIAPAPYTEPDLDAIKQEEYEKGYKTAKVQCNIQAEKDIREVGDRHYQKGLNDAWEAARKICLEEDDGGIPASAINDIFNVRNYRYAVKDYSASEAVEKIREYEQKQEKKDSVWIANETWIVSEANEPSVDTTLICSKCGYAVKIKPHETPALNFCPKCGDCKKPKDEES